MRFGNNSVELERIDIAIGALREVRETGRISDPGPLVEMIQHQTNMPVRELNEDISLSHPFLVWHFANAASYRMSAESFESPVIRDSEISKYSNLVKAIDESRSSHIPHFSLNDSEDYTYGHINTALHRLRYGEHKILDFHDWVRIRTFRSELGHYHSKPFSFDDALYDFNLDFPLLMIKLSQDDIEEEMYSEGFHWISKSEIRFFLSIICCTKVGNYSFLLSKKFDLPLTLLVERDMPLSFSHFERAYYLTKLFNRMYEGKVDWGFNLPHHTETPFKFGYALDEKSSLSFYDSFDLNDGVLLRVGACLIKSRMLWLYEEKAFREEALTNVFFALEGAMRLVHQNLIKTPPFEFKKTVQYLLENYPEMEGLDESLAEAYDKRIQIVHPENRKEMFWRPELAADDFYFYYRLVAALIYLATTSEIFQRDEW